MLELPALIFLLAVVLLGLPAYFVGTHIAKQFKFKKPRIIGVLSTLLTTTIIVFITLLYVLNYPNFNL